MFCAPRVLCIVATAEAYFDGEMGVPPPPSFHTPISTAYCPYLNLNLKHRRPVLLTAPIAFHTMCVHIIE
jgi:hypothetical protein